MVNLQKYRIRLLNIAVLTAALQVASCGQETDSVSQSGDTITPDVTPSPVASSFAIVRAATGVKEVSVGDTFTLDIELDKFPVTEGGGINISYKANVLQAKNIEFDSSVWNFAVEEGTIDNSKGVVSDILFSSYTGAEGKVPVVKVTFSAVSSGSSDIALSESSKNPFASNGERIDPEFVSSHVAVR
jgi:hypothetical protein